MPADAPKGYEGAPSDAPSGKRADTLAEDASGTISQPHERLKYYVAIARPDHWVKNVFMLLGTAAAFVIHPSYFSWSAVPPLLLGLFSVCLIASSNYVLNEILDARFDRAHPEKRLRPLASGLISRRIAYLEWGLLGCTGMVLSWQVNRLFFFAGLSLWVMGIIYNVPPVRSKEVPIVDVLSEAINNPIRLLLGWCAIGLLEFPPSSLLFAYWSLGAFFMAGKRFAEYREIGDRGIAARYRKSFAWYTQDSLMISMLAYASGFMFFFAVIMTKYHPELILSGPFLIILMGYTASLAFEPGSIVQHPERLFKRPRFLSYAVFCLALLLVLSLVKIPAIRIFLGLEGPEW
jgi:4-hydroxybenzoate polyprenyltransferase